MAEGIFALSFESRLRKETPRWVADGIVSAEQVERIHALHPEAEGGGTGQSSINDGNLRVEYDIEKYFVPEGKGQPRFKEMVVEATVSTSHRLGIKQVLFEGQTHP